MCLRWHEAEQERLWELPDNVCLVGPPPERFGRRKVGNVEH